MKHDEIHRILSSEDTIEPSTGFLDSVMRAVERQHELPPLPFPWRRALPGLLVLIAAFVLLGWQGLSMPADAVTAQAFDARLREIGGIATMLGLDWAVLAIAIALLSVAVPVGLAWIRPITLDRRYSADRPAFWR